MSTADHPQTNNQTERSNCVVADLLRTIATSKEWRKHLTLFEFAINNSVHSSTGETPFYVNGLRHPRMPVSFVCIPSLSGGGLTTRGADAEDHIGSDNVMAETRSSDPSSVAVVTTQESVKSESRHTVSLLQNNDDASPLATTTHGRPLDGVIGRAGC